MLLDQFGVGSDVWSVTSYSELRRDAQAADRWNRLNPGQPARSSWLEDSLAGISGPFVASSDNVRLVPDQIRQWVPGEYLVLGTDGFGRSETRPDLRRHFEIDAESISIAALLGLARSGDFDAARLPDAIQSLGLDPNKIDPVTA